MFLLFGIFFIFSPKREGQQDEFKEKDPLYTVFLKEKHV